jgi:hypothetical protein
MAEAKSDIKQSDEWQQAVAYEITDQDIERQRKLLGYDQAASRPRRPTTFAIPRMVAVTIIRCSAIRTTRRSRVGAA